MGYTPYWFRPPRLDPVTFDAIRADLARLLPVLTANGLPLAGPDGTGDPVLAADRLAFNEIAACGHPGLPAAFAADAAPAPGGRTASPPPDTSGLAAALLPVHPCSGDCSHDAFVFERVLTLRPWDRPEPDGRSFRCCKTARKPYDLAVTAALIAIAHHGPAVTVASDGTDADWALARTLCAAGLGYGATFRLPVDDPDAGIPIR